MRGILTGSPAFCTGRSHQQSAKLEEIAGGTGILQFIFALTGETPLLPKTARNNGLSPTVGITTLSD